MSIFLLIALFVGIGLLIGGIIEIARTFTHCPLCNGWASLTQSKYSDTMYIVCRHCDTTSAKED